MVQIDRTEFPQRRKGQYDMVWLEFLNMNGKKMTLSQENPPEPAMR
jgi:hypothetical protein